MKQYQKTFEDLLRVGRKRQESLDKVSSTFGSAEELAEHFRGFYYDAHRQLFDIIVKQVWLEQQFVFEGQRRGRRWGYGHKQDIAYGFFMRKVVGVDQRPLTSTRFFSAISSYCKDLFPEFLQRNPFEDPEYFKYPFENVTLDQMFFVYMCHERLDMLQHAEDNDMDYWDFANWAVNHVLSYNEEVGKDIYYVSTVDNISPIIRNREYTSEKRQKMFDFE